MRPKQWMFVMICALLLWGCRILSFLVIKRDKSIWLWWCAYVVLILLFLLHCVLCNDNYYGSCNTDKSVHVCAFCHWRNGRLFFFCHGDNVQIFTLCCIIYHCHCTLCSSKSALIKSIKNNLANTSVFISFQVLQFLWFIGPIYGNKKYCCDIWQKFKNWSCNNRESITPVKYSRILLK